MAATGPVGDYNALKALVGKVLNSTHMVCETVRLHNAAPAMLSVSMDGGHSFLPGRVAMRFVALVEVAVGRRPYTAETQGELVVKVIGSPLLSAGGAARVSAALPPSIHAMPVLINGSAAAGRTSLVSFALSPLPPAVFGELVISVALPAPYSHTVIEYHKNFQRAPPPSNPNITLVVSRHHHRDACPLATAAAGHSCDSLATRRPSLMSLARAVPVPVPVPGGGPYQPRHVDGARWRRALAAIPRRGLV